jgi:formylglycine-generating enzyme required for sulfatase activity
MGAGYYGQLDLGGELWGWNLDWLGSYAVPCTNCAEASPGVAMMRVQRGGVFNYTATGLLLSNGGYAYPAARNGTVGFRCARAP